MRPACEQLRQWSLLVSGPFAKGFRSNGYEPAEESECHSGYGQGAAKRFDVGKRARERGSEGGPASKVHNLIENLATVRVGNVNGGPL